MTGHFNIFGFLRKIPTDLLRTYCFRREVLADFQWKRGRYQDAGLVAAALQAAGEQKFQEIVAELQMVWDLAELEFTRAIMNEVRFHGDDEAAAAIKVQRGHLQKALWIFAERKAFLANSKILRDVDKLAPRS